MGATKRQGNTWALVLAAGSGTRLSGLTRLGRGAAVPKQYCSLSGGPSLLRDALRRAARVVPPERTLAIVADEHRIWWRHELIDLPQENVVVQPLNRGTATGVLLPLLEILRRDPEATVVLIPSDHFVADEGVLERAVRRGLDAVRKDPEALALLGIEPDAADSEYGWIVPDDERNEAWGETLAVRAFVEKPRPALAADLMRRGAVWNAFLVVASGAALRTLYRRRRPSLLHALSLAPRGADGALDPAALTRLYASLPISDFSRELLQGSEERLRLVRVPACGWSDLGTPERLAECLRRWPAKAPGVLAERHPAPPLVLARALRSAPERSVPLS